MRVNKDSPSPQERIGALPLCIPLTFATYIAFTENELYPSLISLSPLATASPRILQHSRVQSLH